MVERSPNMAKPRTARKVRFNCFRPQSIIDRLRLAAAAEYRDMTGLVVYTLDRSLPPLPVVGAANGEA